LKGQALFPVRYKLLSMVGVDLYPANWFNKNHGRLGFDTYLYRVVPAQFYSLISPHS
jgi:hypothetical protein